SCQKEHIDAIEPVASTQVVVAPVNKIVYLDYFLQEVPVDGKQKLVITSTLSEPAPKEIQVNYLVFLNTVITQVKVVIPAGRTNNIYETQPYTSSVPFEINDLFVTSDNVGWTIRYAKP
ncbi:MAG TPA: hypothetical protein VK498_15145, partial [Ferruginibacter sp.]|nr:hypothetical protein [Ferruginibacter sp.]